MMLVMNLQRGTRPAAVSALDSVHRPVVTSWHDGFGDWGVIHNHRAVWKEMVGQLQRRPDCLGEHRAHGSSCWTGVVVAVQVMAQSLSESPSWSSPSFFEKTYSPFAGGKENQETWYNFFSFPSDETSSTKTCFWSNFCHFSRLIFIIAFFFFHEITK